MKRFLLAALLCALMPFSASAIQQNQTPLKFNIPWGNSAGSAYIRTIPQPSQIGVQPCAASLTDGFPPQTFVPAVAGGCPPFGQDFNGILQQISQWSRWYSAGGPIFYDSTFATSAANGYPNGAIIQSTVVPGDFWMSTADNNTSNPDTGGANWVPAPGSLQTGMVQWTWTTTAPNGWILLNPSTTIGNGSSGATLASSTTQFLYSAIWNGCSNSLCPVTGGRGANAASDYSANKPIQLFSLAGTILIGNDFGTGILSGVPTISGTGVGTNLSLIGEVLHTLTATQLPSHTHNGSGTTGTETPNHTHSINNGANYAVGNAGTSGTLGSTAGFVVGETVLPGITGPESVPHTHSYSFTTDGCGSCTGSSGNNTPRAMVGYWMIKL